VQHFIAAVDYMLHFWIPPGPNRV